MSIQKVNRKLPKQVFRHTALALAALAGGVVVGGCGAPQHQRSPQTPQTAPGHVNPACNCCEQPDHHCWY
jgi:hypothetical protein